MAFNESTGIWYAADIDYWVNQQIDYVKQHPTIPFNVSVGSNYYFDITVNGEIFYILDNTQGLLQTKTLQKLLESKIEISSSSSITQTGVQRAFLSLTPLVQKASIIQATIDKEDWYIFLELDKPFSETTSVEKETLLTMGAMTQGNGRLPSKYPDLGLPSPIVTIEGIGMVDGAYQEKGVYTILNELQKTEIPKLLIRVVILDGLEDAIHYDYERVNILNDFKTNFAIIQGVDVDFLKIDYVPVIHTIERKEWMYDFNFYDDTDPANPLPKNHIVANEYEYMALMEDDPVKVLFFKQGTYNVDGTYTEGELIT